MIALKAAISYLVVAVLWVVLTERVLTATTGAPLANTHYLKDISFILMTTSLIFGLVFRIMWRVSKTQQQASESQERYQALFHGSEDPVFVYTLNSRGQPAPFSELNDRACARLRYPRNALLSKSLNDIVPPDALPDIQRHINELVQSGRSLLETALVRSDGCHVPFELNVHSFELSGQLTIVAVARDLTIRQDAEQALQDSEQRYRLLAENASDIIWTADIAGRINYISPSVERLLGYSPEELSERFGELVLTPSSQSRLTGATHALMRTTPTLPIRVELEVIHRDQQTRWLEANLSLLRDAEGAFIGIQGVGRDIHARKLAEQEQRRIQGQLLQAQKMDAVGTLAGGIAHDLNNLLIIMLGNVEMAQLSQNAPVERYLVQIQRAAERAADLVQKLLLFSRQQPGSIQPIDLNDALTAILEMLDRTLGERISVETVLAADLWTASADRGQLEQIVLNLAVNARDAMPDGGTLTIQTDNLVWAGDDSLLPGKYIRLRVTDTGEGMDEMTRTRIFEPFFTTKDIGSGTGLGLSTVYGIVQEHSGLIRTQSQLGVGSTFTVLLPATSLKPPVVPAASSMPSIPSPHSLLLIEDEDQVREFMTLALTQFGYRVTGAASIAEALQRLEDRNDFELIICDVILPDGTGPVLIRSLLESHPDMPVLLISGHTGKTIEEQFGDSTPPRLLRKPFTLAQLFESLQEVMGPMR